VINQFRSRLEAIIFDFDGTVVDSEPNTRSARCQTLKEIGITKFSPEQAQHLQDTVGLNADGWAAVVAELFPESNAQAIAARAREIARQVTPTFIPGFEEFYAALVAAGVPCAVATNGRDYEIERKITAVELEGPLREHAYGVDCVGCKQKPDPAIFLYATQQLGVSPEASVVFEDSFPGFTAAGAAGMACVGIEHDYNMEYRDLPDAMIASYDEAIPTLLRILGVDAA
jgi:beta-phosphoglucomutase-like phosphatase (HAD superfamily)